LFDSNWKGFKSPSAPNANMRGFLRAQHTASKASTHRQTGELAKRTSAALVFEGTIGNAPFSYRSSFRSSAFATELRIQTPPTPTLSEP
jgi:hypothetical protein